MRVSNPGPGVPSGDDSTSAADFAARARIRREDYQRMYEESVSDSEKSWGRMGARVNWIRPYTKVKDVSFDGYAEPGSDIGSAWRSLLAREGKLNESGTSLRDLVLGTPGDQ